MRKKKLSEQQLKFCEHYLKSCNATKSMEVAKYSVKNGAAFGYRMFERPYVQDYMAVQMIEKSRDMVDGMIDSLICLQESIESSVEFSEIRKLYRVVFNLNKNLNTGKERQ